MYKKYLGELNKTDTDSYYTVPHFVSKSKKKFRLLDIFIFIIFFISCYITGKYLAIYLNPRKIK
jgi:hypothetical protein